MTAQEAISYLYQFDIPSKFRSVVPARIFSDYVQHCYLELYNVKEERLQAMFESGRLQGYFFRLCKRQANNPRSKFYQRIGELRMVVRKTIKFEPLTAPGNTDDTAED